MRIYRNEYSREGGISGGFSFHTSKAEALKTVREHKRRLEEQYEEPLSIALPLEIETDKKGIVSFLNMFASHPDNG